MNKKTQFSKYSKYYDSFYKEKEYTNETNFLKKIITKFGNKNAKTILSLGCGTCTHDILFAKEGYSVSGVDLSSSMLKIAKQKAKENNVLLHLFKGDVRSFRTKNKFDIVIAMFNIAGYQNTLEDFNKFIKTAEVHLKKGGVLLFDAWYQPAVLKDRPTNRKKQISLDKNHSIERETTQKLDIEKSLLEIIFKITEKQNGKIINTIKEKHPMRFFTLSEIEYLLNNNEMKLIKTCQTGNLNIKISENSWDMFVIAKKI